ncbi:phytanoyl-CoA dioxygenase family protein, partial [Staphylococcus epidermidis]|uniref:phytanoyl-CoA dioxygenase family protein n=1 Tax=Staphylococcus epidermidis TaxID=1282 RepID=UPI0033938B0F
LDDVTAANGAMKIIPGSHREFRRHENLASGSVNGEFGNVITELPESAPDEMICEMEIGSVLIFSDLLIHASCPNTAGIERYALIGTY